MALKFTFWSALSEKKKLRSGGGWWQRLLQEKQLVFLQSHKRNKKSSSVGILLRQPVLRFIGMNTRFWSQNMETGGGWWLSKKINLVCSKIN